MSRSDRTECIRGCMGTDHYAACPAYGAEAEASVCGGCVPAPGVDGTLLCDRCYRRLRFLLHGASDILGRMRTLALQGKAVVYSPVKASANHGSAPDQVDPDLLEATNVLTRKLDRWGGWIRSGRKVLDAAVSDEHLVHDLCADILDLHPDGEDWSLADAHARWGIERRDRFVYPAEDEPGVVVVTPVREWFDPLLPMVDAAKRAGISERQLRSWVKDEVVKPAARMREAGVLRAKTGRRSPGRVTTWFRASEIDAAAELMRERREDTRLKRRAEEPAGSA